MGVPQVFPSFAYQPAPYVPPPAAAPNGTGFLVGGAALIGGAVDNWISPTPQTSGAFGAAVLPTVRNTASGFVLTGGQAMAVVASADGVPSPKSGAAYQYYMAPGFATATAGGGIQSQPRVVYSGTEPWQLYSSTGGPYYSLFPPGASLSGSSQTFGASTNLGSNTTLNPDNGSVNATLEVVDVLGNRWTQAEQIASYSSFAASWVTVSQVTWQPSFQLASGQGAIGDGPASVVSVQVGLVAGTEYATTLAFDQPVVGPYDGSAGNLTLTPAQVQGPVGVLAVPGATFALSYPASPTSGTNYRNDVVVVDPATSTYKYVTGNIITTAATTQVPGSGIYGAVPAWLVTVSTTSGAVTAAKTSDLRNIVGSGY